MSTQEDAYEYSQPGIDDREWTGDDPKAWLHPRWTSKAD